jgi:hypothetical protein
MTYPNGTIGCPDPEHKVGESAPAGLSQDEHIRWVVDHAPLLTSERGGQIGRLLGFHDMRV